MDRSRIGKHLMMAALLPWVAGCQRPPPPAALPPCAGDFGSLLEAAKRSRVLASSALARAEDRAAPGATALREARQRLEDAAARALARGDGDPSLLESSEAVQRAREAYEREREGAREALRDAEGAVRGMLEPALAAVAAADALPLEGDCAQVDGAEAYGYKGAWLAYQAKVGALRDGLRMTPDAGEVLDGALTRWRAENPDAGAPPPPPTHAHLPRVVGEVYGRVVRVSHEAHLVVEILGPDAREEGEDAYQEVTEESLREQGLSLEADTLMEARECEVRVPIYAGDDPGEAMDQVREFLSLCAAEGGAPPEDDTCEGDDCDPIGDPPAHCLDFPRPAGCEAWPLE